MRRIVLAILFAASISAAWALTPPRRVLLSGKAKSAPAPTFLLDSLAATPAVAYSTRKVRAAYAGSALRVIRASDSTQSDIGFAANGQLNTTTLATFCAATSCSVQTWYDQSINAGPNASGNPVAPAITNAGTTYTLNGFSAIRFGPVSSGLLTFVKSLSQPTTIALAAQHNSEVAAGHYTDGIIGADRQLIGTNGTTAYQLYAGIGVSGGALDLLSHDIIGIFNGASSSLIVDGATVLSGNVSTNPLANQIIGGGNGNTAMDGWMGEYIVFPQVLGGTDQATIRASWQTQWGTQ